MKHFTLIDGKLCSLRDGDYHPLPFDDVLEIYEAATEQIDLGTKALEEMNGSRNNQ